MIDKETLRNFRNDFAEAVKDLEQQYGIVITLGRITFDATSFSGKLEAKEGESKDQVNEDIFNKECKKYGLDPEDYDRRFTYQGKEYTITGIYSRSNKYPICCLCLTDNKTYRFTAKGVRQAIGK